MKRPKKIPKKIHVNFRLLPDLRERLAGLAEARRISRNKLVELILHDFTTGTDGQILTDVKPPEKEVTGFLLPRDTMKALKLAAARNGVSRNSLVETLIEDHIERAAAPAEKEDRCDATIDLFS